MPESLSDTCESCGAPRIEFPMIFRNDPWCSDDCKKRISSGERPPIRIPQHPNSFNNGD